MTKLCNACEYLKFCARSGIEDVGCDRYKKDMTTNEEWIKSLDVEELAAWIYQERWTHSDGWYEQCGHTVKEVVEWLKQPHSEVEE